MRTVEEILQAEIDQVVAQQTNARQLLPALETEETKLTKAERAAWKKHERRPQDGQLEADWQSASAALHRSVMRQQGVYDTLTFTAKKLKELTSPAELERRLTTRSRIERLREEGGPMATKTKKEPKACECGCGGMTKGGRYIAGHDARHKSALVAAALEGDSDAEKTLKRLGWTKFLTRKREIIAALEKKAEEKAAAKETKAREAAAAKAAKAEAKATSKSTNAKKVDLAVVEGGAQAKPDPKPEKKPRSSRTRKVGA